MQTSSNTHACCFITDAYTQPSLSNILYISCCTISKTENELFPIVWDTIEALEMNNSQVVSITSDGAIVPIVSCIG